MPLWSLSSERFKISKFLSQTISFYTFRLELPQIHIAAAGAAQAWRRTAAPRPGPGPGARGHAGPAPRARAREGAARQEAHAQDEGHYTKHVI